MIIFFLHQWLPSLATLCINKDVFIYLFHFILISDDECRVTLEQIGDEEGSNYINASFIQVSPICFIQVSPICSIHVSHTQEKIIYNLHNLHVFKPVMAKMHKSYRYLLESSCTEPVLKLKIILVQFERVEGVN